MVSELLERAGGRRDGTEKDFLRFWSFGEMSMKLNKGQLFRLHGSTDMGWRAKSE